MEVTEYIAMFAEYVAMFINMIKEFFASLTGGAEPKPEGE